MTENHTHASALDPTAELDRFLAAYRPTGLPEHVWVACRDEATALVRKAGEPTRARGEKDIQALGAVLAHLQRRGRPLTITEALADTTLLNYDTELRSKGVGEKTRENKRGIVRRLQCVHHGLPWRAVRRADGARVSALVPYRDLAEMHRVLSAATTDPDEDAAAFTEAVAAARLNRRTGGPDPAPDPATWGQARRYAAGQGLHLTRHVLRALVTHEVLARTEPVAVLITAYALTRRDLELALTHTAGLPAIPTPKDHDLLRGH